MTEWCQMFISLVSGEYPPQPGGVGDYTRRLGAALVARGHQVQVLTIDAGRWVAVDVAADTRQLLSHAPRAAWDWRCWRAIDGAITALRPDVLHIQYQTGAYGMHPAINLLPWYRRRHAHPLVAVTMHDLLLPYLFPKAAPLRRWVTGRIVRDTGAIVVTNADDYDQLTTSYLSKPVSPRTRAPAHPLIIPIGSNIPVAPPPSYDRAAWRARLGVRADAMLIAYFGLISRSKGLDVLLHALARLPDTVRVLVIGGAATAPQDHAFAAEIVAQIDALGLRQRVQLTGHVAEAEVSAHLLAADVAALPFADGASLRRGSLLAALAHGLPVVTTEPGVRDQGSGVRDQGSGVFHPLTRSPRRLVDGEHTLLVPPNDARALAAAITRLAGDAALRAQLGAGGQAFARQFDWGAIAEAHEALYQQAMTR